MKCLELININQFKLKMRSHLFLQCHSQLANNKSLLSLDSEGLNMEEVNNAVEACASRDLALWCSQLLQ